MFLQLGATLERYPICPFMATRPALHEFAQIIDQLQVGHNNANGVQQGSPARRPSPPPMSYPTMTSPAPQVPLPTPAGVPSEWWNNVTGWLKECTEEVSALRRENDRREQNEARLAQHHHTLVSQVCGPSALPLSTPAIDLTPKATPTPWRLSQVSELNKRLHEAMSTANEAKEEARLQRQGHAEVLAFCRESAQGCNTVTRKCMDDTRQYVAVEVTQPESPRDLRGADSSGTPLRFGRSSTRSRPPRPPSRNKSNSSGPSCKPSRKEPSLISMKPSRTPPATWRQPGPTSANLD